jgi:hypothetical protein
MPKKSEPLTLLRLKELIQTVADERFALGPQDEADLKRALEEYYAVRFEQRKVAA